MITVHDADRLLREHARVRPPVVVPLVEAGARVLREDVAAEGDHPPFDRVAMDGIAVTSSALADGATAFPVVGLQRAGEPQQTLSAPRACLEVMTGASLPRGTDTVIRYEDVELEVGVARLKPGVTVTAGQHVHTQGSDRRRGERVLAAGTRLFAPQIAVLASEGKARVRVAPTWRISVLTTGDELVDVTDPVLPHQIRRSNPYALRATFAARGDTVRLFHAPDEESVLGSVVRQALEGADVLISSGGVSMGKFDLVPAILARGGVRTVFHKIAQKPGKPLWFGLTADARPVFGLPGNPVSALVCLHRYVLPFLDACAGAAPTADALWMRTLPRVKGGLTHFVPVRRQGLEAIPVETNGSGDYTSLGESDGFVELAPEANTAFPGGGYAVPYYPWRPL